MGSLNRRVALITGAGSGLGRAYAFRLAKEGARIAVNDLSEAAAAAVCEDLRILGVDADSLPGDVADWGTAERLVGDAIARFGDLHVLVNNAGNLRERSIPNMTEAEWDDVVRVHLKGHFSMLRWASRYWRDRFKAGDPVRASVINTTSNSGLFGQPMQASYGAAKAGIAGLTMIAAAELGRFGVRVNAISPAAHTGMTDAVPAVRDLMRKPESGLDPWDPDHAAALVAYLARETSEVTGQCWLVFGGRLQRLSPWGLAERVETEHPWTPDLIEEAVKRLPQTPWIQPVEAIR